MEEIPNNHLTCINPFLQWDIYHIIWCRISSINSTLLETNSSHLKIDGWKMKFPFEDFGLFAGAIAAMFVSRSVFILSSGSLSKRRTFDDLRGPFKRIKISPKLIRPDFYLKMTNEHLRCKTTKNYIKNPGWVMVGIPKLLGPHCP